MRYWIALVVAFATLLLAGVFTLQTERIVREQVRLHDAGYELPPALMTRVTIADMILARWFVLGPLVTLFCFGIAALSYRLVKPRGALQESPVAERPR
jgi:hypothetical protein